MARKKAASWQQLAFSSLSPVRVLVTLSLLVNVVLASTLVYLNSREGDSYVLNMSYQHLCYRDYSWLVGSLTADHKSLTGLEQTCGTGAKK